DLGREQAVPVDVAEFGQLAAAGQFRPPVALRLVAVTTRAAQLVLRERLLAGRDGTHPAVKRDGQVPSAGRALSELAPGVDAHALVAGHAAADVARHEHRPPR